MENIKNGDILVAIGGYNRTYARFYIVTRQTAKSLWMVELEKKPSTTRWAPMWTVLPTSNKVGKEIRKIKKRSMDIDGLYLTKWDGKPVTETSD